MSDVHAVRVQLQSGLVILLKVACGNEDRQHTISVGTRLCTCAVYLRENIQSALLRPTHFAHAGLAWNVLKNL